MTVDCPETRWLQYVKAHSHCDVARSVNAPFRWIIQFLKKSFEHKDSNIFLLRFAH
jgi:hypothetical protein